MSDGVIDNEEALKFIRAGGAMDYAKVRELVHLIRGIEHGVPANDDEHQEQLSALDLTLWNAAAEAVVRERDCIEAVSSRLAAKVHSTRTKYSLQEDELRAIPELATRFEGGGPARTALGVAHG